ncbi:MAG: CCA tRNA nucleotidyltransferase [Phycisphaeraceae bacterium]
MASAFAHTETPGLREAATQVVKRLQEHGHVAYFAGGCVRDQIMGRVPTDYDVATDAPPQRVIELFRIAHRVGEAFGVVVTRISGHWIEVATFRTESGYADGRHPDQVAFTDAEHDARRRDFTINGLFYDPLAERVIDYVQGQQDIEARIIRAIGDPQQRFDEDYLRMLRAVRFAARLEFTIEPATAAAVRDHAARLDRISRERIGIEVALMLDHPHRARAAQLMQHLLLDAPTLCEPHSERQPLCVAALPPETPAVAALAAWALDRHLQPHRQHNHPRLLAGVEALPVAALVRRWRKALVLSNDDRDALRHLLQRLPTVLRWPDLDLAAKKRLLATQHWPHLAELAHATLSLVDHPSFDVHQFEREVAALQQQEVAPPPLVTGDDLIAAGLKPGPKFKTILEQVYDAQLRGEVTTHEQALHEALTHHS